MLFSSMIFLWCFLPIVLVVYYILSLLFKHDEKKCIRIKNIWLLMSSMFFYAWGGGYYLLIMLCCILINYCGGLIISKAQGQKKKVVLIITVTLNLAILFVFKYANMVAGLFGAKEWKDIVLPIGISFFIFQAMSYVIDLYWEKVEVQNNLLSFALYVSLFPQLVAGPIVKYSDISGQLDKREENMNLFYEGQRRFCYGLGKKVLIANVCAGIADEIWAGDIGSMGASIAWLGALAYTIQIYYDFSGYSDMAIGIGRMFGFRFKENFNYPYMALSIQDFWRRWHMSLSGWFKEYVYIPLGGNRKGMARTCINLFIVFLLTGIWHGAGFNFILWGAVYGVILIIERLFLGKLLNNNPVKIINYIYTILIVAFAWILFRADSIGNAVVYIKELFVKGSSYYSAESYLSMMRIMALVAGLIFMGPIQLIWKKYFSRYEGSILVNAGDMICQLVILGLAIVGLTSGTYNPFIYFRF